MCSSKLAWRLACSYLKEHVRITTCVLMCGASGSDGDRDDRMYNTRLVWRPTYWYAKKFARMATYVLARE
ncbi:hypothetical protein HanHA300_Chr09g0317651 [Helianthus annuus]|nr:hypothetical protein HanHA300_Chr09g0317651 [Helianthus annuus]KAJ0542335.1 hypothetical protein HanHA89_Chr09g0338631 [Helianthus annuus]KAJ0707377.1 hypothetical protein HanLR1_Chr09g0317771 [Helianthus annuus]